MTQYCVRLRFASGRETVNRFSSMLERALWIIGTSSYATVVNEWMESAPAPGDTP